MDAINITQNDFLDVLFDNRNKDYGAYDLRRYYERRMRNAIGITAGILLVMTGAYVVSNVMANRHPAEVAVVRPPVIPMDNLKLPEEKVVTPPPPPAASVPKALKPSIQATTLAVVPDNTKDVTPPPTQDEMRDKVISTVTATGDVNGSDVDVPVDMGGTGGNGVVHIEKPAEGGNDHPFAFVEVMPSFPGGEEALMKFLHNNVRYPAVAQENDIQGTVAVQFVVMNDGTIQGVKVVGAAHGGGLEEEAMRVVRKMPKWKAGRQNGRDVAVYFTLPIRFTLQQQ